jgi:hypothetical protein
MPTFVALQKPRSLPTIGEAIERSVMDWKVKASPTDFEKAKDVAMFANHLGGTLLVGAGELSGQLNAYVGMTEARAGALRDSFSKAIADRCQPRPAIDFEEYEDPHRPRRRIVAINVSPSLNLVGVKVAGNKRREGYGGPAYVFPVRSGTDARYLEPGQLAMFMTPQIRRVAVMLARIPTGTRVTVVLGRDSQKVTPTWFFDAVVEEENVAHFRSETKPVHLPIDRILSVYQDPDGWRVVMDHFR